jgi:hypothetical protein
MKKSGYATPMMMLSEKNMEKTWEIIQGPASPQHDPGPVNGSIKQDRDFPGAGKATVPPLENAGNLCPAASRL